MDRATGLFEKEIIAKVKWEEADHQNDLIRLGYHQFKDRYYSQWESQYRQYEDEYSKLSSALAQIAVEARPFTLMAPKSGTLLLNEGIDLGSWIQPGQELGKLSPETALIVEAYVPSHKMGQIFSAMEARYQIDAFNYRQWRQATGKVLDNGKDIEVINQQALFKVRCSLDQKSLQLANGVQGNLQKGLGLTVLFYQTKRSLFDLLYDDINDWINPNQP